MRVSVIGAGYVGLVSAVCFADRGYDVILSTEDQEKAKMIRKGIPPFHETDLEPTLKRAADSGRLQVVLSREDAVLKSDMTHVAVGTPCRADGNIDLRFVKQASRRIGEALRKKRGYHLLAVRSTVVPGTTDRIVKPIIEKCSGKVAGGDFGLVMQPEFLRQGSAIHDTLNSDRIIVGEYDARSGDMLLDFWKHFYREKLPPTLRMNLASAEMVKYASNAFLATKVSFINEVANICENVPGVDVAKVAEGMGFDQRIGRSFLRAGAGFGGSCFPKDLKAIIAFSKDKHCEPNILKAVLKVNKDRPTHVVELVKGQLRTLKNKRIAVLGLSFKPGTDDLREAPSLRIIGKLLREGAEVVAYDPVAMENARRRLGGRIVYAHSARSCLEGADTAIVVTEWDEFAKLEPSDFHKLMRSPILIDARRIYDAQIYSLRLRYSAVGLGQSTNDPNQARVLHSTRPEAGK